MGLHRGCVVVVVVVDVVVAAAVVVADDVVSSFCLMSEVNGDWPWTKFLYSAKV